MDFGEHDARTTLLNRIIDKYFVGTHNCVRDEREHFVGTHNCVREECEYFVMIAAVLSQIQNYNFDRNPL